MPTLADIPSWADPAHLGLSISDARLLVLVLGAILVVAGARAYRLMIITPGFAAGVFLAVSYSPMGDPWTKAAIAAGCGVLGALLMFVMEQTALRLVGVAIMLGLTEAIAPHAFGRDIPWFLPYVTGAIGAVVFPMFYRRVLTYVTPFLGAIAIAWSLGRQRDLPLILGLGIGGAILQTLLTARGKNS